MTTFQTYETTGAIDEDGVLHVEPFVGVPAGCYIVSIRMLPEESLDYDDSDPGPEDHAAVSATSATYWTDPDEDIYTVEDGKPYDSTQD